jgi:hypothetical protein
VLLSLILSLAAGSACSPAGFVVASIDERHDAIINGDTCSAATNATAVAILIDASLNLGGQPFDITTVMCTGTLIAPDTVLTAAHCTDPTLMTFGFGTVERADFYVTFEGALGDLASSDQNPPPELPASAIPVRSFIANEGFDINELNGGVNGPGDFKDIALMFLDVAVDDVKPEIVITEDEATQLSAGLSVEIAGWGQQVVTGGPFEAPPPGSVGVKVCGASTINELGDFEMQIGGDGTTTRKCHGDSGGPTYIDVDTGSKRARRVIGVTSHAYDQEDCNKGGVDTRIDVWLDWIDEKMSERCVDGTRVWCDVDGIVPPSFFDTPTSADRDNDGAGDDDAEPDTGCGAVAGGSVTALALLLRLRRTRWGRSDSRRRAP